MNELKTILIIGPRSSGKSSIGNLLYCEAISKLPVRNSFQTGPTKSNTGYHIIDSLESKRTIIDTQGMDQFSTMQNVTEALTDLKKSPSPYLNSILFVLPFGRIPDSTFQIFQRCTQLFSGLNRIFSIVFTNCFHMAKSRNEQQVWIQMQKADPRFMEMYTFCEKRVVFIENPPYDTCADDQELRFDTVNVQESKNTLDQLLYSIDGKVALADIDFNQEFVSNSSTPKIGFIIHTDDFQSRPASPLYDRRAFDVEHKPETLVNSPRMDGYGVNPRPYESPLPTSPYNAPRPVIKSKTLIDRNLKLPSIRSIDGLNQQLPTLAPSLHGSPHGSPVIHRTPITPGSYSGSPRTGGTPTSQYRDESAAASLMTFKNSKYDGHSSDESQEVIPSKKRPPPDNVQLSYKGRSNGNKRGRQNHTYKQNELLKDWMQAHRSNPYPTEEEKLQLMKETGLTLMQVNTWFINARRRFLIKSVPTKEIPDESTEQILLQWMLENLSNPYPDEDTKEEMCGKRRWEKNNLNAWLTFVRKKYLVMNDGVWERIKEESK